jgi:hypothetical protein
VECPTLEIDLNRSWAEALRAIPADRFAASRRVLESIGAHRSHELLAIAPMLVHRRTEGRFEAEINAYAAAAGVEPATLMIANLSYDLLLAGLGCSTLALATPTGPVLARNMDWVPERPLAQASCQVRYVRGAKLQFVVAGWPGASGVVTGLSTRGFAIALNAVDAPGEPRELKGYPVLLFLRRVLEAAANFDQARDLLARETLASPALFTIVGTTNDQRAVVERSRKRCAVRAADGDQPLVATNDYRRLYPPRESAASELTRTTCHRYDALCGMLAGRPAGGAYVDEELLYLLTDSRVKQTITAQHVIARPARGEMRTLVPRDLIEN